MTILSVLIITFFAMIVYEYELEEEMKAWKSPYDESLITQNVVLEVADDEVSSILQAVGDFLLDKGESNNLSRAIIPVDTETLTALAYSLRYEVEPIDIYTGYCTVYCDYIENQWVITKAEKQYNDFERKNEESLNISDIEAIYEKNLQEMQKENFYGGYRCTQDIGREKVTIWIFGEEKNEFNYNVLIKRILYDIEKDEYSIDYSK